MFAYFVDAHFEVGVVGGEAGLDGEHVLGVEAADGGVGEGEGVLGVGADVAGGLRYGYAV